MKKILLIILIIPNLLLAQGPTASFIYNPVCLGSSMIFLQIFPTQILIPIHK